ncbi:NADP-dependent oxidoreductase [Marivirga sp. S37H4]|uniref:NADP-dependent oxidoreductase n=1 Tax=Marivirga aurantiaca TaxID=2802615 RepID=A0A934X2S1_9BACT|nr:NADP-dependent oxidoreductase [Marivirga aurantiaca]MBK6267305.1 NADP-dependent oxidoreductase [Marivirga aurantiaca]
MKAAILEEFNQKLKIKDIDKPEVGEGMVLVKIKASGINPVDQKLSLGYMKDRLPYEFPIVLGWDMAGEVEECGHGASRFRKGEEVYAYARRPKLQEGTFAEYIAIPESYLAKKPINISFEEASAIPLAGLTAYQSLFDAGNLKTDETVLILGASGGVGTFAVQLAKYHGSKVIAVASEKNHAYLKELGADHCIDYKKGNVAEEVKKIEKEGVPLVFDAVGGETTKTGAECLHKGGRLVSITSQGEGLPEGTDFRFVFVAPNARELEHIREMVEAGSLKVPIQKQYSLEEINEAFEQIDTGHTRGKIVVSMN